MQRSSRATPAAAMAADAAKGNHAMAEGDAAAAVEGTANVDKEEDNILQFLCP